jgi:hypothetical protein
MTKQELIDELIRLGYDASEAKIKRKAELEDIYNNIDTVITKDLVITSKRSDRYWLEDGSEILFKDIPEYIMDGQITPYPKAKDFAIVVNGRLTSFILQP